MSKRKQDRNMITVSQTRNKTACLQEMAKRYHGEIYNFSQMTLYFSGNFSKHYLLDFFTNLTNL